MKLLNIETPETRYFILQILLNVQEFTSIRLATQFKTKAYLDLRQTIPRILIELRLTKLNMTTHQISQMVLSSEFVLSPNVAKEFLPNVVVERLTFKFHNREVQATIIGPETGYPDCGFSCFPQCLQAIAGILP
jgi:hypothetical protein